MSAGGLQQEWPIPLQGRVRRFEPVNARNRKALNRRRALDRRAVPLRLLGAGFPVDSSGCSVDGFGEGGVDVDGPAEVIDGGSGGGGDEEFVDEVGGVGSDDGGTNHPPAGSGDDLDEAGCFADGAGLDDRTEPFLSDHGLVAIPRQVVYMRVREAAAVEAMPGP